MRLVCRQILQTFAFILVAAYNQKRLQQLWP
jgi:hypothetical protein